MMPGIEILGYGGAKGGGKSYLGRSWQILRRMKYPRSKGLLIRKTFPEIERNHIEKLRNELPRSLWDYNERKHVLRLPNGSLQEFAFVETKKDLSKYQGAEYDDIFIDEAEHHEKEVFTILRSCLRSTNPKINAKMLVCFNPGSVGHAWLKKMFVDRVYDDGERSEQFAFLQALVTDNPSILDNDPDYIKRLEALPEPKRSMYLRGNMNVAEGAFFPGFGSHLSEEPFLLNEMQQERLYGSLDHGIGHNTSFGLNYLDSRGTIHRLMTYCNNGFTARHHANEIFNAIQSFKWTRGTFPLTVWADPTMWTDAKLNENIIRSPMDEYKDVFAEKEVEFVKANNNKPNGCDMVQTAFELEDGIPGFKYWRYYNKSFEVGISAVQVDENNKDIYAKMDGDDCADEARYGIVGLRSDHAMEVRTNNLKKNKLYHSGQEIIDEIDEKYKNMTNNISLN